MSRRRSSVRKRRRSRTYSSDSRSYSRSRSPSTSEPSRGGLRQPPQLRGAAQTGDDVRDPDTSVRLAQKSLTARLDQSAARITALEAELNSSRKSSEALERQLAETSRKLKKAEAAQATYEKWLEALSGVADRVVKEQQSIQTTKEALRKLEAEGEEGRDDLALYVKETNIFLAEQAENAQQEKIRVKKTQPAVQIEAKEVLDTKITPPASVSNEAGESQSVFRPGIKFKLNP